MTNSSLPRVRRNPRGSSGMLNARTLLYAGLSAVLLALWLRYVPSPVRDAVTRCVGAEGRALLEHLLAGVGLPLSLNMMLLPKDSSVLSAGPAVWQGRLVRRWAAAATLVHAAVTLSRHGAVVWSIVYVALCVHFEFSQATVSAYGGPPRGYLQYGQLLADAAGAGIAVILARRATRVR